MKWIPVSERLSDEQTECLILTDTEVVCKAVYRDGFFHCHGVDAKGVLAWTPTERSMKVLEIEFKTGAKVHGCVNQLWFDDGKLCFTIEESEGNAIGRQVTIPIKNVLRFTLTNDYI